MTHPGWLAVLTVLAAMGGMPVTPAWAQGTSNPAPITPPGPAPATPPGAPDAGAVGGWAAVFVLAVLGLIVILAVIAKYRDLRNRREADALALQSRLSDALLTDQALDGFGVIPTVHISLDGSRATIELTGHVLSPAARERVLRAVKREAQSLWAEVQIQGRLLVLSPVRAHAA
jgi:hypothetical protein